jgi:tRNA A37 threonylcarbamoyladenosine modification protein TsaB
VLDAQRGELYAAPFDHRAAGATRRLHLADLVAWLQPGDTVIGPLASLVERHASREDVAFVEVEPAAIDVAKLAWHRWLAGEIGDPLALVPAYHRASAAEEKARGEGRIAADGRR